MTWFIIRLYIPATITTARTIKTFMLTNCVLVAYNCELSQIAQPFIPARCPGCHVYFDICPRVNFNSSITFYNFPDIYTRWKVFQQNGIFTQAGHIKHTCRWFKLLNLINLSFFWVIEWVSWCNKTVFNYKYVNLLCVGGLPLWCKTF